MSEDQEEEEFDRLLKASSLGSPIAVAIRAKGEKIIARILRERDGK
jgi:hypothetical protein